MAGRRCHTRHAELLEQLSKHRGSEHERCGKGATETQF